MSDSALVSSGALTGRLDELERLGLIRRSPHPSDRRVVFAELTNEGVALIGKVFEAHLANEHEILGCINATKQSRIAADLAILEDLLQQAAGRRARRP